ncbi:replicative DNA helicase [Mycoplasma haemofelis str. Langford 1]|uniref:DNA 5'-3' helicase n=2 Tax=Mycoplasma haemofelis TaxID=29501 RepID=F6FJC1_MYCHI|nr:DnaB-like helicase C-terminal domain-containing protein [Mycoplasma haemofelis]AEG72340.1 replicative DNA helicase, DnaB [Mycoplasma haemofelis Ohio2]CBY92026.1 replicative DNA helicase [Mycoplasma haemofelis str. Langford 1]
METNVFEFDRESLEAEKGIIASIFYYFSEISEIIDIDSILLDNFITLPAKRIFNTLRTTKLVNGSYDPIIVLDSLKSSCLNEQELNDCTNYLESLPRNIQYFSILKYLNLLQEQKVKRKLDNLSRRILRTSLNSENFNDQISTWKNTFEKIISQNIGANYIDSQEAINNFQKQANEAASTSRVNFLKTNYSEIDRRIKALSGGQLVIVASRPGVGKTTFSINLICNNLRNIEKGNGSSKEPAIGIFSLEMTNSSLLEKLIAIDSGLALNEVQKKLEGAPLGAVERALIDESQDKISRCNLLFSDESNITLGKITAIIKTWAKAYDLKFVIIDYLQLINVPEERNSNMNQYQKIGIISRTLKILSMELNTCIISLAQLNRKSEERKGSDKVPILSDLRESGSIEQDADIVMFIYEDKKEDEGSFPKTILKIAKNRHGPTGNVEFQFDKSKGLYKLAN